MADSPYHYFIHPYPSILPNIAIVSLDLCSVIDCAINSLINYYPLNNDRWVNMQEREPTWSGIYTNSTLANATVLYNSTNGVEILANPARSIGISYTLSYFLGNLLHLHLILY